MHVAIYRSIICYRTKVVFTVTDTAAIMKSVYLIIAILGSVTILSCQDLPITYNVKATTERNMTTVCPATHDLRESIEQDIRLLVENSVLPILNHTGSGHGACDCGGPGWRRVAYLNMFDPTQTCPPAWELITTPRRSCGRPSSAGGIVCNSAMFPTQGIQYSQVCGRIIGYQVGHPEAFVAGNIGNPQTIDGAYVDGVSLTYGNPRQHIWSFACAIDERGGVNRCPCTDTNYQSTINIPSYVGNDYFCETGVPTGQIYDGSTFHADDPLWDGQGCGPDSTCCTFNNPPWFCKQLPQSTNADLEVRLCSYQQASIENTPIELLEIYTM